MFDRCRPESRVWINGHGMVGAFQDRDVGPGVAVGGAHSVNFESLENFLAFAAALNHFGDESQPSIDNLDRRSNGGCANSLP